MTVCTREPSLSEADKLRATARLVLKHRWDGKHFAHAVRAWEQAGQLAPAQIREVALRLMFAGRHLSPLEVASVLRQRAAEVEAGSTSGLPQ